MRRLVAGILVLVVALAASPRDRSSAQSIATPSSFALAASDFPPGSQIVESGIASNIDLAVRHLQIGPAPPAGRTTGYYMQARTLDGAGRIRLVTSYLVSLYATPDTADLAFTQETDYWRGLIRSGAVERPLDPGAYGEPGRQAWYALPTSAGDMHSELFFRRGMVFIQMNLDSFGGPDTAAEVAAFLEMGTKLDLIASGRLLTATLPPTATSTATPHPTATRTPVPTARATSTPRPTSTPTLRAVKPVKELKPCKKGYKQIRGKCQKVPVS